MYMSFALNYAKLAEMYLQAGELVDVQHALDRLARVMPELSEEDRVKFTAQFNELQKQLREMKRSRFR
jgi:hypothetical protein